jgi:flagellar hook-length control protein FliK
LISKDVPVGKSVTQSAERVDGEPPRIAEHKVAEHKVSEPKVLGSKVAVPNEVAANVVVREIVVRNAGGVSEAVVCNVVGESPKAVERDNVAESHKTVVRDVLGGSPKAVERVVPDAPKTVAPYRREEAPVLQRETVLRDAPVRQSATVLREAPVRQSVTVLREAPVRQSVMALHDTPSSRQSVATLREAPTPHRASHASSPEPVEIIAPVPLPIELPAAAIQHQPSHPVASADVTRIFVAAAEAVADAILVSSGFANGEGRLVVRLQPEVLNGSEVQIVAKGGTLTVVVNPATQDVQNIVEANRTQFEQHLAEKVHAWRVSVAVKRGDESDERV